MSNKQSLRQTALQHRKTIDASTEPCENIVSAFFDTVKPDTSHIVSLYWPVNNEFDVRPLIMELLTRGHDIALPVMVDGRRDLEFRQWNDGDPLNDTKFGIREPFPSASTVIPDILIVPLLSFDRRGYRLGYGGGYYDATIAKLRTKKHILTVGMAYEQQLCLFPLPIEEHDEKLDFIITPGKVYVFK